MDGSMGFTNKDEVVDFLAAHGFYDPWKAEVRSEGVGYTIHYTAGMREEVSAPWRPTLRWALRSAKRGCNRRNRRRKAGTWTVEGGQ